MASKTARIVLVEDNPADVLLVRKALQEKGIAVDLVCFEDGQTALNSLLNPERQAPDLILLDLNLPKTEGVDVLREVHNMPKERCWASPSFRGSANLLPLWHRCVEFGQLMLLLVVALRFATEPPRLPPAHPHGKPSALAIEFHPVPDRGRTRPRSESISGGSAKRGGMPHKEILGLTVHTHQ